MDDIYGSIYWCILQVSLVVGIGTCASMTLARRRPFAACAICCATALVAALLTILTPLSLHRYSILTTSQLGGQPIDQVTQHDNVGSALPGNAGPFDHPAVLSLKGESLVAAVRTLATAINLGPQARRQPIIHYAVWCWGILVAIGLLRLGVALAFVRQIRREGVPIIDPDLLRLVEDIAMRMKCREIPLVRVGRRLKSAAVAGWFHPIVILPHDWGDWNDDERQAVIAHELAHVLRHDSLWRTLAAGLLALHFGNPLVHWLLRRVTLCQEISADLLAAGIVGSRTYLHSLSSLAIRQDDQVRCNVHPDVLPVFSGELIRRITMLRSMDGTGGSSQRSSTFVTAGMSCAMFAVGLATIVTRGFAQPPTDEASQKSGTVKSVSVVKSLPETKPGDDKMPGLFHRQPLNPAIISANNGGMIAIRMREILARPEWNPLIPSLNAAASEWLKSELKWKTAPPVHLETIDWVAGQLMVSIRPAKDGSKNEHGRLMFGTSGVVIKLVKGVDLKAWVSLFAPDAKQHVVEGRNVFELSVIPALGPIPCWIGSRDETTILVSACTSEVTPQTTLADIFNTSPLPLPDDSSNPPASETPVARTLKKDSSNWAPTWQRIDGGLVTVAFTNRDIHDVGKVSDTADEFEKVAFPLFRGLVPRFDAVGCSLDIAPEERQLSCRARFTHSSHESADQSIRDIRELIALAKVEIAKQAQAADSSDATREWDATALAGNQILQMVTLEVQDLDNGSADVIISLTIPLETATNLILAL